MSQETLSELSRKQLATSIEVMEASITPLIDRHNGWIPRNESPSASLNDETYGTMPKKIDDELNFPGPFSLRPKREPIHFERLAGAVLGIDPDSPSFENRVRQVDGHFDLAIATSETPREYTGSPRVEQTDGWYSFLLRSGLSKESVTAMKRVSEEAYVLNTNTEDNLPSYVLETMGAVKAAADKLGIKVPALEEWFRGIWPREENGHLISMNAYGQIRRLTTSEIAAASRNSQLLTGSTAKPGNVINVFCYTPRQEYSTKLAHSRDGLLMGPVGYELTREISIDEARHEQLYTGVLKALLQVPELSSIVIKSLAASYRNFFMPGQDGIPEFTDKAKSLNEAKIYGLFEDFVSAKHVLRKLDLFEKRRDDAGTVVGGYIDPAGLDAEAQAELEWLRKKFDKDRQPVFPRTTAAFVLGQTITEKELRQLRKQYTNERLPHLRAA